MRACRLYCRLMFLMKPFFIPSLGAKGKIRSTLACNVGKVMLMVSVCVFCWCVAVSDILTAGTVLKFRE